MWLQYVEVLREINFLIFEDFVNKLRSENLLHPQFNCLNSEANMIQRRFFLLLCISLAYFRAGVGNLWLVSQKWLFCLQDKALSAATEMGTTHPLTRLLCKIKKVFVLESVLFCLIENQIELKFLL